MSTRQERLKRHQAAEEARKRLTSGVYNQTQEPYKSTRLRNLEAYNEQHAPLPSSFSGDARTSVLNVPNAIDNFQANAVKQSSVIPPVRSVVRLPEETATITNHNTAFAPKGSVKGQLNAPTLHYPQNVQSKADWIAQEAAARDKQLSGAPGIVKKPLQFIGGVIDKAQANIPGLADFQQGAGNALGIQQQTAPTTGGVIGKAAKIGGYLAGGATNPAALEASAVTGAGRATTNALERFAPNTNPFVQRLAGNAAEGAMQGGANTAASGRTSVKDVAEGVAFGGLGGAAFESAGTGLGKLRSLWKKNGIPDHEINDILGLPMGRSEGSPVHQGEQLGLPASRSYEQAQQLRSEQTRSLPTNERYNSAVQRSNQAYGADPIVNPYTFDLPNAHPQTLRNEQNAAAAHKEMAAIDNQINLLQSQYEQQVINEYKYLKDSMGQGKEPGMMITDPLTGNVVDKVGSISRNPKWYQEISNKANGYKKPSNKELYDLARNRVDNGFHDEQGYIPSWKQENGYDETLQALRETRAQIAQGAREVKPTLNFTDSPLVSNKMKDTRLNPRPSRSSNTDYYDPNNRLGLPSPGKIKREPEPWEMTRSEFYAIKGPDPYSGASPSIQESEKVRNAGGYDKYLVSNPRVKKDAYGIGTEYEVPIPEGEYVTVYRAATHDEKMILPGKYVTLSEKYAQEHMDVHTKGIFIENPALVNGGHILKARLKKSDVVVGGGNELWWAPKDAYEAVQKLAEEQKLSSRIPEEMPLPQGTLGHASMPSERIGRSGPLKPPKIPDYTAERQAVQRDFVDRLQRIQKLEKPIIGNAAGVRTAVTPRAAERVIRPSEPGQLMPVTKIATNKPQKTVGAPFEETPKVKQEPPREGSQNYAGTPKVEQDISDTVGRISKEPRIRDRVYNFLDEQEKAARKRISKRRGNLNSNPLPEWGDMTIIMAAKTGKGTIKLADFTEAAVKEFGEGIRAKTPQLFRSVNEELKKKERMASREGKAAKEFNESGQGDANSFASKISKKPTKRGKSFEQRAREIETQFVDDWAPAKHAEKAINGGKLASAEESLYKTGRMVKGAGERALQIVRERLNPLIKSAEKAGYTADELGHYALAKHAKDVNEAGYISGFTNKEIDDVLKKYGSSPEMEQARKGLVQITRDMMQELVDSDMVSKELQDVLNERWKNYIPLFRALDDESLSAGRGSVDKLVNISSPIKKLEGSKQDVVDPLENVVKNIFIGVDKAARGRVGQQFTKLAKKDVEGRYIRKLSDKNYVTYKVNGEKVHKEITQEEYEQLGNMSKEERTAFVQKLSEDKSATFSSKSSHEEEVGRKNVINVKENGQNVKYELDPELYKAAMNLDQESSDLLTSILSVPTSILRAGATLTPDFSLRNPFRDVIEAFVKSKSGFNPFTDFAYGLSQTIKKGDLYKEWVDNLGAFGNSISMDRNAHREALSKVLKEPASKKFVNIVTGKSMISLLRKIGDISESATKVGEYRAALRQGQSKTEAAFRARDIVGDFSKGGSSVRKLNRKVAFLNANIQGKARLLEAIKDNPVKTTVKAIGAITLPTLGILAWNHIGATDTQKNTIAEAPDWMKDAFWLVAVPGTDVVARIPKPFDLAPLFANLPERVWNFYMEKQSDAMDGFARRSLASYAIPTQLTGLLPIIEGMANYSFFREGPIIPQRESGLNYSDQYDPIRTTETAKLLASGVNKLTGGKGAFKNFGSPRVMDNTIQGITAGLGGYATSAVDSLLQGKVFGYKLFPAIVDRPVTPQKRIEQRPFVKSFTVDPLSNSKSLDKLYNERESLTRASGSAKLNKEKFSDVRRLKELDSASTNISKISTKIRNVESSKKDTAAEKRKIIEELLQKRAEIVQKTMQKR